MNTAAASPEHRPNYRLTFAVLTAGVSAFALLQSLVIPVLPTIQGALHTSQTNVTWVLTAYLLSASIFTPLLGRLGDMTGKKRMFVVCLTGLAVGSLLGALATSLPLMLVARVIQGAGGGLLPLAFGIIRDEFPREKVSSAIGTIASLLGVGVGVGIVLAGPIVDSLDYHWLFWIPLFLLVPSIIAAHFLVPESTSKSAGTINWGAAALMSAWLVALLVAVSEAPDWGWASARVIGLIVLAVVLAALWIRIESRSTNPLIDMSMMKVRAVWACNLAALLLGVGMYSVFAFLPEFLQTSRSAGYGFGASITASGVMLLPMTVFMFILGTAAGHLARRLGSRNLLVAGAAMTVPAYLIFAFAHDEKWQIYLGSAILGSGIGLAFSALSSLVVEAVPAGQTGVASGMNANIRTIGGALGSALMASIVTSGAAADGLPKESGYVWGFVMVAVAGALSAAVALLIPALRRDPVTHLEPEVPLQHAELAMVAAGTLVGDESE